MFSKIILSGNTIESSQISNIWPDIPSGPDALEGLMRRIRDKILSLVIETELGS